MNSSIMQTRIDEVQPYGDDMKQLALLRTVCVGAAVLSLAHFSWTAWSRLGGTDFDDAFIFIRYAKHWLSGAGFSWNAADGTAYGITSFLHLFVVTLLRALTDLSDAGVLTAVSFVAALLSCVVLIVLGFLSVENAGFRKTRMPLLVVPCLLLGSSLGYHSVTGMETTLSLLANALLACCVVLWSRNRSLRGLALCLLSAYVSFLTRPDNGLYAWLLPPLFLVASDRRLWRYSLSYAFLFVLVLVCDGALKKAYSAILCLCHFSPRAAASTRDTWAPPNGTPWARCFLSSAKRSPLCSWRSVRPRGGPSRDWLP